MEKQENRDEISKIKTRIPISKTREDEEKVQENS